MGSNATFLPCLTRVNRLIAPFPFQSQAQMRLCWLRKHKVRTLRKRNDGLILIISSAGKKTTPTSNKTPKKGSKEKTVPKEGDVSNGVSKLKISDIPPPKSKGLDVIKEFENNPGKRSASFVVVGKLRYPLIL